MLLCVIVTVMTEDLTVSDASLDEAPAIAEIYSHYVLDSAATFEIEPPDAAEMRRRIEEAIAGGYPFLVTRDSTGRVLAYGFAQRYGPRNGYRYSVETTIYVRRGFRQAFAVIAASEPSSVVLHARAGYFPVGTLTGAGWKHGQWFDVFLMQRKLGEGNETPAPA